MAKMSKENVKETMLKSVYELTAEELDRMFGIFCLQVKEYQKGESQVYFEIHFERTLIIQVRYPKENGLMGLSNDFVILTDGCHGISMKKVKSTLELIMLVYSMFENNLLADANYGAYYNERISYFTDAEEAQEYLEYVQLLMNDIK